MTCLMCICGCWEYKTPVHRSQLPRSCCLSKGYVCLHLRSAEPTYSPAAQVCNTYLSWFTFNVVALHAGQVILVWPHQMYLTGITAGVILMVASGWFNIWSMWILVIFYMERKNKMVRTRCASACMSILFSLMLQYPSTIEQQEVECHKQQNAMLSPCYRHVCTVMINATSESFLHERFMILCFCV